MRMSEFFVSGKTASCIKEMYRKTEAEKRIRLLGKKRAKLFSVAVIFSVMIAVPVTVIDAISNAKPVTNVSRNGYGEGDRTVTLEVRPEGAKAEKITVKVSERRYSEAEINDYSKQLDEVLWKSIMGKNTDPEEVVTDLVLRDHIEGFPFSIEWTSDKPLLVGRDGVINNERLSEEDNGQGILVRLCASVSYKDYKEDKYSYVRLRRRQEGKSIREMIEMSVKESDEMSREDEVQKLPDDLSGRKITFYASSINKGPIVFALGIIVTIIIMADKDDKIRKEAKNRRKQIEADHARILNQYALYHTAGMNPRTIWSEICKVYENRLKQSSKNRRYAFDEMIITKKMMDEGAGEMASYDDYAHRIGNIRYRSFISLIKQAAEKGGSGLTEMLYEETEKAQKERMAAIREQASEAQTKLLLPMFMMLIVVIVIVMVPAMIGLN